MVAGIRGDFRSYARSRQSHVHDYAQVVLPLSGEMEMIAGGRQARLSPMRAMMIGPETPHDFESARNGIFLVLDIAADGGALGERSSRLVSRERNKAIVGTIGAPQQRLLRFLAEEFHRSSHDLLGCQSLLEAVIALIDLAPADEAEVSQEPGFWNRAPLRTVRSAATYHGMSESTFRRAIKASHGDSPKRLQMDERLAQAERLLLTTNRPVSAIAFAVGFGTGSALTNAFRRRFGMTPSDFRTAARRP